MTSTAPPPTWAIVLAFGVIYTAWGTTYFAIKLGVQHEQLPPALFSGVRLGLAGLILLGWQAARRQRLLMSRVDLLKIAVIAALLFLGGNGFVTAAQKHVDSSLAAVLIATTPLWIGLFATLLPRGERLTPLGWLGLLFGLAGVTLLVEPKLRESAHIHGVGVPMVLASAALWALGSVLLRSLRVPLPHLSTAGYQMALGGAGLCCIGALLGEAQQVPEQVSAGAMLVFLYLLLVGSLSGFVAFNWLLGHVSAARVGTYAYVNPLVAVCIGWFFGEEVTGRLWLGIAVILAGVFLVRGGERRAASPRPSA
jgi:drug/metabolite transporter (DMT)-like permease